MGPSTSAPNPSYREVCSGTTGHVEVYDCEFDGNEETYEQLVRHFFMFHDPTTLNKQGNDRGTQYASVLYCYDQKQVDWYSFDIFHSICQRLYSQDSLPRLTEYNFKITQTEIANKVKTELQDLLNKGKIRNYNVGVSPFRIIHILLICHQYFQPSTFVAAHVLWYVLLYDRRKRCALMYETPLSSTKHRMITKHT